MVGLVSLSEGEMVQRRALRRSVDQFLRHTADTRGMTFQVREVRALSLSVRSLYSAPMPAVAVKSPKRRKYSAKPYHRSRRWWNTAPS